MLIRISPNADEGVGPFHLQVEPVFWKRRKPSEILIRHVEGKGNGYELDDFVNSRHGEDVEEKVVAPILDINRRFSTREHPLGISNPDAYEAIVALANELKENGF